MQIQLNVLTNGGRARLVGDGLLVTAGEGERGLYLFLAGCIRCILAKACECMLMSCMYIVCIVATASKSSFSFLF